MVIAFAARDGWVMRLQGANPSQDGDKPFVLREYPGLSSFCSSGRLGPTSEAKLTPVQSGPYVSMIKEVPIAARGGWVRRLQGAKPGIDLNSAE